MEYGGCGVEFFVGEEPLVLDVLGDGGYYWERHGGCGCYVLRPSRCFGWLVRRRKLRRSMGVAFRRTWHSWWYARSAKLSRRGRYTGFDQRLKLALWRSSGRFQS